MTRLEDDVLSIYDDTEGHDTVIAIGDIDGYSDIDEAQSLTLVIAKSNGDGAIVKLGFSKVGVTVSARAYAESQSAEPVESVKLR